MESKPAIQSKTYWGIGLMILSYIGPFVGSIITSNAPAITDFIVGLTPDAIAPVVAQYAGPALFALGAYLAKFGRDTATQPISGVFKKK